MIAITRSFTITHPSFAGLVASPVHEIVPLVRPADVDVHQDPHHRKLRETVDVGPRQRPHGPRVQHRRKRRKDRQPEKEDQKEDGRRNDKRLSFPRQLLKRRCSLYANPLVLPIHETPFLSLPRREARLLTPTPSTWHGTILQTSHTVNEIRTTALKSTATPERSEPRPARTSGEPPGAVLPPGGSPLHRCFLWWGSRTPAVYALAPPVRAPAPALCGAFGGRMMSATMALAAMMPAMM